MQASTLSDKLVQSVILNQFGGYDKIKVEQVALKPASCGDQDVEVNVKYCGVNFADIYLRQGLLPHIKLPHILGLECVGNVEKVGNQVKRLKPGDRVLCYRGDGGLYRETVILDQQYCFSIPDYIEDRIAVALPANYLTARFSLFDIGGLKPGYRILIHSCAGGVGWALTQLAKMVQNVTIVGTASPSKHLAVKNNGVDHVISSENYLNELHAKDEVKGLKFDLIIDSLGGSNVYESLSLLSTCGKVVVIGANQMITGDQKLGPLKLLKLWWNTKNVPVVDLIVKNCAVAGLHLTNLMENSPEKVHEAISSIFNLYQERKIKPRIDSEFSFPEVTEAMKKLGNRENIGKVIIKI